MGATSRRGFKSLTAEEERELVRRSRAGDRRALDQLIAACLPFVGSIAVEYRRWGHPLEDIVQEGCMGLIKAIDRFDPERGCRLITYACYWIRAEIRAFVVRAYRLVRIGTSKAERRALRHFRKTRERDPQALAEASGLSVERAESLLPALLAREASLDDQEGERSVGSLRSVGPSPEDLVANEGSRVRLGAALAEAVSALPERERIILQQRYLCDESHTLEELGRSFGISKERVRQLEERAMKRVRDAVSPMYVEDRAA